MKLFKLANMDIISDCLLHFKFPLTSEMIQKKKAEICEQICLLLHPALAIPN